MRTLRNRRFIRSLSLLLALALLSTSVVACGGGGGASKGAVDGDEHATAGWVNVTNSTGFAFARLVLTAQNGSVTVTNVADGGYAEFTNVLPGAFSVNAYSAAGYHLAGASGNLSMRGTYTLTLR